MERNRKAKYIYQKKILPTQIDRESNNNNIVRYHILIYILWCDIG
ncbi:hypothetical protein CPL00366_CDS0027 [Klebsiella phage RareGolfball]